MRDRASVGGTHSLEHEASHSAPDFQAAVTPPARPPRNRDLRTIKFDPQRRATDAELRKAIQTLVSFLESREDRKRRRTVRERQAYTLAVEAIACNLIIAELIKPRTEIVVQRGHGSQFGKRRYASPIYGRHFLAALDLMEDLKLIKAKKGFRYNKRFHGPSTIAARRELAEYLPLGRVKPEAIGSDANRRVLILKASKGDDEEADLIDYVDTPQTIQLREQIKRLNGWLADAPLELLGTTDSIRRPIDGTRRTVTRVFNNGSWEEGGRLGGAPFWADMPRADRFRLIRIGGHTIVNVDYSQLQPRFAFALAGAPQPERDLYDVTEGGWWRKGWKKLVAAMLYARSRLKNWPRNCRKLFEPDPPGLGEALAAVEAKLAPIAHLLGTGIGYRLLKTESDMLLWTLEALHEKGIVALPVHDAVIVDCHHGEVARDAMQAAAKRFAGVELPVHIDRGDDLEE